VNVLGVCDKGGDVDAVRMIGCGGYHSSLSRSSFCLKLKRKQSRNALTTETFHGLKEAMGRTPQCETLFPRSRLDRPHVHGRLSHARSNLFENGRAKVELE
jgi:hypothetical protein